MRTLDTVPLCEVLTWQLELQAGLRRIEHAVMGSMSCLNAADLQRTWNNLRAAVDAASALHQLQGRRWHVAQTEADASPPAPESTIPRACCDYCGEPSEDLCDINGSAACIECFGAEAG